MKQAPPSRQEDAGAIDAKIAQGHYAAEQINSRSRIVAFSHGARFRLARQLVAAYAGKRLLDYGSGDGTFLAMVADLFPDALGADICPQQVAECTARLGSIQRLRFQLTHSLRAAEHNGRYDLITCMETMEHCVEENLEAALEDLARLLAPGGRVVISVPIEIGPILLLKQIIRRVAGWRKIGHYEYTERYSWPELIKMVFAGPDTRIHRDAYPVSYPHLASPMGLGHKGFNWKALRSRIRQKLQVEQTLFSPANWSRGLLSSQAWFVCTGRAA